MYSHSLCRKKKVSWYDTFFVSNISILVETYGGYMPKKDYSEIICIIDRSGSMDAIKDDAIGGFNSFLESQKRDEGTASLTLVLFDNEYLVPINNEDIRQVPPLNEETFVPRGSTALLDAVGQTIDDVGRRLAETKEELRPETVIVAILTDGEENSSRRYSRSKIKKMIEHQSNVYSWEFVFLAANQDAFAEAESIGIKRESVADFEADSLGVARIFRFMSEEVSSKKKKYKNKDSSDTIF